MAVVPSPPVLLWWTDGWVTRRQSPQVIRTLVSRAARVCMYRCSGSSCPASPRVGQFTVDALPGVPEVGQFTVDALPGVPEVGQFAEVPVFDPPRAGTERVADTAGHDVQPPCGGFRVVVLGVAFEPGDEVGGAALL
jgi:hypothetical protein